MKGYCIDINISRVRIYTGAKSDSLPINPME